MQESNYFDCPESGRVIILELDSDHLEMRGMIISIMLKDEKKSC
jgi:hypothetical protein